MKKWWALAAIVFALGCREEEKLVPMSEYESADLRARTYNFQVYPGARFLEHQTELLRKAHFALNPNDKHAPPMAIYDTEAPLANVVKFYTERYETGEPVPNESNGMRAIPPAAYYSRGNLAADAAALKPFLDRLGIASDVSKAEGEWQGANFMAKENLPRVTLQRPYFDAAQSVTVDRTLIVLVRE